MIHLNVYAGEKDDRFITLAVLKSINFKDLWSRNTVLSIHADILPELSVLLKENDMVIRYDRCCKDDHMMFSIEYRKHTEQAMAYNIGHVVIYKDQKDFSFMKNISFYAPYVSSVRRDKSNKEYDNGRDIIIIFFCLPYVKGVEVS